MLVEKLFEQFFSREMNTEMLFVSFYFVGFVSLLAVLLPLSFMVHRNWRQENEHLRIRLLNFMAACTENLSVKWGPFWLAVIVIAMSLGTLGLPVVGFAVVSSMSVVWVWGVTWAWKYPVDRILDLIHDDYYRRYYPQLRDVTDGFGC